MAASRNIKRVESGRNTRASFATGAHSRLPVSPGSPPLAESARARPQAARLCLHRLTEGPARGGKHATAQQGAQARRRPLQLASGPEQKVELARAKPVPAPPLKSSLAARARTHTHKPTRSRSVCERAARSDMLSATQGSHKNASSASPANAQNGPPCNGAALIDCGRRAKAGCTNLLAGWEALKCCYTLALLALAAASIARSST